MPESLTLSSGIVLGTAAIRSDSRAGALGPTKHSHALPPPSPYPTAGRSSGRGMLGKNQVGNGIKGSPWVTEDRHRPSAVPEHRLGRFFVEPQVCLRNNGNMRIGFDCAPLVVPHSPGITRVVADCLAALERRGKLDVVRLTPAPGESLRLWRQREVPRLAQTLGLQGVHAFQAAFPLRLACKRVQTVHELSWRHGVREPGAWRRMAWVRLGKFQANAIVTATHFTAHDLLGSMGHAKDKVHVIPWAQGSAFGPELETHDESHLERFGLNGTRFVLSPGGWRSKKRPLCLLHAVERLRARGFTDLRLVVTGPEVRWTRAEARHLQELQPNFLALGHVHDCELATLYRHAAATVVISRSEGFALPVLEALASGSAVVVPAQSAQAEVAGPLACLSKTGDSADVANTLEQVLLGQRPSVQAAIEYASGFTWERTAIAIERLWEELA